MTKETVSRCIVRSRGPVLTRPFYSQSLRRELTTELPVLSRSLRGDPRVTNGSFGDTITSVKYPRQDADVVNYAGDVRDELHQKRNESYRR